MTTVSVDGNKVNLVINRVSPYLFTSITALLKQYRVMYNPPTHAWQCSYQKYMALRDELEELDQVVEDTEALLKLREGTPQLVVSDQRIIADYSLLTSEPFVGKAPYENFQREAVMQGLQKNRYAFFLGQGSGKSYIAAALIAHHMIKWHNVSKVLVLSTAIGARNVYAELTGFIKGLDASRIVVANKKKLDVFTEDYDIVVASYNTFRLICARAAQKQGRSSTRPRNMVLDFNKWRDGKEMMLILDESHEIANPQSQRGHLVQLHASAFYYRYLFTGTPADKPEKLYNQLKILDPVLVHDLSYNEWLEEYAVLGTRYSQYAIGDWKHEKFLELNQRVERTYATTIASEKLLDLPPHYIKKVMVEMSPIHKDLYEALVEEEVQKLVDGGGASVRGIVNRFPFLMLAVDNPKLLEKHAEKLSATARSLIAKIRPADFEKFSVVQDIVEDHRSDKGVLWVEHPLTAATLKKMFDKSFPLVITGETAESDRKKIVDEFQKNDKHKILIANIKVLSTSVTITAATYQVYVERGFAYVPYEQSIKRIYRIGQNNPVVTYIPLYAGTLDILRDENLSNKGEVVKGLLGKSFLTQQQWASIFNGQSGSF